jgi:hypothetical protein
MQAGRFTCAATLDTGKEPQILVIGGLNTDEDGLSSTEVLHLRGTRAARRRR